MLTMDGVTKRRCEWAKEYGLKSSLIKKRMDEGWDVKRAITTPNQRARFIHNGKARTLTEWCRRYKKSQQTVSNRLKAGWTLEEALTYDVHGINRRVVPKRILEERRKAKGK